MAMSLVGANFERGTFRVFELQLDRRSLSPPLSVNICAFFAEIFEPIRNRPLHIIEHAMNAD